MAQQSIKTLDYVINHIALPTQLPDGDEGDLKSSGDAAILMCLVDACRAFRNEVPVDDYQAWTSILRTINQFRLLHSNDHLRKDALKTAFVEASQGCTVIIHVAMQNAALIVRKEKDQYHIEAFEVSPSAAAVLAAQSALQIDYPHHAVTVPAQVFETGSFCDEMAEFIEKASVEHIKQFAATTLKANIHVTETRDTSSPTLITDVLMAILEANGGISNPKLTRKRVHDDVIWSDGSKLPWRRSSTWLALRVGIQRALAFTIGGGMALPHYKFFMAFMLHRLCIEACKCGQVASERLAFLRTKLGRRLAKLEHERSVATVSIQPVLDAMFERLTGPFQKTLQTVNDVLAGRWGMIRTQSTKRIPRLPTQADEGALQLSLVHSSEYINRALEQNVHQYNPQPTVLVNHYRIAFDNYFSYKKFKHCTELHDYFDHAGFELWAHQTLSTLEPDDREAFCIRTANLIGGYLSVAVPAYKGDALQTSLMILIVMELWVAIDRNMVKLHPLLLQYPIEFPSSMFHVLQLPRLSDMRRLQEVENYLATRRKKSIPDMPSIFADPTKDSFGVCYYDSSSDMQALRQQIVSDAQEAREAKEEEWETLSQEYEDLMAKSASKSCVMKVDLELLGVSVHDDAKCTKCFLERKAKRMRIGIHEDPLPTNVIIAKAVVFELLAPSTYLAYRDVTWLILRELCYSVPQKQKQGKDASVQALLQDYSELSDYAVPGKTTITLASSTKSFLVAHYSEVRFPVTFDRVCHPNGLKWLMYDKERATWTGTRSAQPNLAAICSPLLPKSSAFATIIASTHPVNGVLGRTSNQVIASQLECPKELTVAEFSAFQELRIGYNLQWVRLLRELVSPSLNIGDPVCSILVTQLALQAGPPRAQNVRRAAHWVFEDAAFCNSLLSQIQHRLDATAENWRESRTVDTFLTLLLRVASLSPLELGVEKANSLILQIRTVAIGWVRILLQEILNAQEAHVGKIRAEDCVFACLLCRRTFDMEDLIWEDLDVSALSVFLECSIILKQNMADSMQSIPREIQQKLVHDVKMVQRIEIDLRSALVYQQGALELAVRSVWQEPQGAARREFSAWTFCNAPDHMWIHTKTNPNNKYWTQEVHYNVLSGTLLIDGRALGRLPTEFTTVPLYQKLFGSRALYTFPSNVPGCTHMAANLVDGHTVHFGMRNGTPFTRVRINLSLFEIIPPEVFRGLDPKAVPDLPLPLVDDCVHLLDLAERTLEVRPQKEWTHRKYSNWSLNLYTRRMERRGKSSLLDPRSPMFSQISSVIEPFQNRGQLIIWQNHQDQRVGPLIVQLPRLELIFSINRNGALFSRQLQAVVDSNQDAGTLYGLASKLVLCSVKNSNKRSILISRGEPLIQRYKDHVVITVNSSLYCRFNINHTLGRLECAPEPRLIYLKAYYHAITSFVLPDPLTGRSGTEEALHCLRSGLAQPWTPVNDEIAQQILMWTSSLSPKREFYPPDLQNMQKVTWSKLLTPNMQHEDFRLVVQQIWAQSDELQPFYANDKMIAGQRAFPKVESGGPALLLARAAFRNTQFHSRGLHQPVESKPDVAYTTRCMKSSKQYANTFDVSYTLNSWSRNIDVTSDLVGLLLGWPHIQGYGSTFHPLLLSDVLTLNVQESWGGLFEWCRSSSPDMKFKLMFKFFGVLCYNNSISPVLARTLVAFSILEDFKTMDGPVFPEYTHFAKPRIPSLDSLCQLLNGARVPFPEDEIGDMRNLLDRKQLNKLEVERIRHEEKSLHSSKLLGRRILAQWPSLELRTDQSQDLPLLDLELALQAIGPECEYYEKNRQLSLFLAKLQGVLANCASTSSHVPQSKLDVQEFYPVPATGDVVPCIAQLLQNANDPSLREDLSRFLPPLLKNMATPHVTATLQAEAEIRELEHIVGRFSTEHDSIRELYAADMQASIRALEVQLVERRNQKAPSVDVTLLKKVTDECQSTVDKQLSAIRSLLSGRSDFLWLSRGGLWPYLTPLTLLETLRRSARVRQLPAILNYGILMTMLQRLKRISSNLDQQNLLMIVDELRNNGHTVWNPADYPDWLLLEIEFNFLIRPTQYKVAMAMLSPPSNSNAVMQLNMGQGKSSVIIPMVASVLADGKRLVRVIVTKPLLLQMAQLLTARLGGLIGRLIRHVPFSRKSSTKPVDIKAFFELHQEIFRSNGIMLVLPEHLLSFKLSGIQCLSSGKFDQAGPMIRIQKRFDDVARDVLDECDHSLAVRTQLIYPSGSQTIVDAAPQRWTTVQAVLQIVKDHIFQLQKEYPRSVELVRRNKDGFPTISIHRMDVKDALIERVAASICAGDRYILPVRDCTEKDMRVTRKVLSKGKLDKVTAAAFSTLFVDRPTLRWDVLLVRGLLAHRILLMALNKRFNVQYGLHPDREPVAVPYHSKGVPSERAEFGHPDVAVILTYLSFYYAGITIEQFRQTLNHLSKADDPSSEYARWMEQSTTVSGSVRTWNAINIDDELQCADLWRLLRHNMATINYYLSHFVFPRHAKVFEKKLVTSGWDIPSFTAAEAYNPGMNDKENHKPSASNNIVRKGLTTGFSGTNDNRYLLPLTIQQRDLPELSSTNAEVLTYLLQLRNRRYLPAADLLGKRFSEVELLMSLTKMNIRMLIDAGAQILEMDNATLAKTWLQIDTEALAAVYFGNDDKTWVVYRDGKTAPLAATVFNNNLQECLVYLDESHTRGTDLKMPLSAVAALTLGPGQTKDHTVQAAMRLRQLGTTQAVVFFAPPEVDRSIRDVRAAHTGKQVAKNPLDSGDVVRWLLEQTCVNLEQLQPLFIHQGLDFCRRILAAHDNPQLTMDKIERAQYLNIVEQHEVHSLEQMYGSKKGFTTKLLNAGHCPSIANFITRLHDSKRLVVDTGDLVQAATFSEVEQEREQEQEHELVREVQKGLPCPALPHLPLHRDMTAFAQNGRIVPGSQAYVHIFDALARTAIGQRFGINRGASQSRLHVTTDFIQTVITSKPKDEYNRPVSFFLYSTTSATALVVSPFEAEQLLPSIRDNPRPVTHLVTYAAPVTRGMLSLSDIDLYVVPRLDGYKAPSWLKRELGLFAGRLYFDYAEYNDICAMMDIRSKAVDDKDNEHSVNGNAENNDQAGIARQINQVQPFSPNPRLFLQEWLAVRRNGQDFSQTPMGHVCAGRRLDADSAFFVNEEQLFEKEEQACLPNGNEDLADMAENLELDDD